MARYTVKQLAELSGISVRTLHYYDQIGLLTPGDVGGNGYRYYDRPEVLRLQQILFYRELGMPLAEIGRTLDDPAFDISAALQFHRKRLDAERARYRRLIRTIDETLQNLDGDENMPHEMTNPFEGFSPEKQAAYERELVDKYGQDTKANIAVSHKRVGKMSAEHMQAIKDEGHTVNLALVVQIEAGAKPGDAGVQKLIARHHAWVSNFWVPHQEAYIGLGRQYTDHPDFRAFYDKYDSRLVEFLAEAMTIYAAGKLS